MIKSGYLLFLLLAVLNLTNELSAQTISFTGTELLGCPTNKSVTINIVPDENIELYYEYGTSPGLYTEQTSITSANGNQPHEVVISGLSANTRYYYRMQYRISGGSWVMRDEHSFETQRSEGSPFKFTITSDSHAQFNTIHQQTMVNVKNDMPDFNIDLGDTFCPDGATSQSAVNNKYLAYRSPLYMGAIGPSIPIFLSSGNHENEEGWNFDDLFSIALASIQARKAYYPTPIPDEFYSGNDDLLSSINASAYGDQYREDYYAWTWGDVLFVVIDPFQYTMNLPYAPGAAGEGTDDVQDGDQWSWTLGKKQFNWFKQTIQNSNAKYKFVFSHQMTGGIPNLTVAGVGPGYVRGGAGAAPYFEWGGKNADGSEGFSSHRSVADFGTTPIHQLMVQNGVSAYFHGHDHQFVYESLDGIVYQELPSPSMTGSGFSGIYNESNSFTHKILPNAGHLRISVTTTEATVDYVQSNGNVAYSYIIYPNTSNQSGITLTSPNGGENWEVNSIHNITWTTTGSVGNVHIEYSINNGITWNDVVASTENNGSYIWTVPNTASTNCIVRISETEGSTSDVSNTRFTISCNSPVLPGTITGNTTVCPGSSQSYSIASVSGATSYAWTLPQGWTGSSTNESINVTAGASGGDITVSAINSCGTGPARSLGITVSPAPPDPGSITGSTTVCQGSSQSYSISPVTGATSYTWTLPSGWSGSSNSASITATAGSAGGTISVTANNSCGSSTPRTLTVSVTALLTQPGSIAGSTTVCQGSSQSYSISPVTGATSYTWTLPSGWSGSSNSASITATAGSAGGTISVTANNSCGSSTPRTLAVSVTALLTQPGSITGSTTVCQGSSQSYSISPVTGATSYTWTLPSGWSGSSNSASITATAGSAGGTISVTANNSCGASTPRTLTVSVTALLTQPGSITGSTTVCQGSSQSYSISPVTGATSYTWTLPSGWSGSSNSASITATAGSAGGTISVTASNSCGTSTERTLNIIIALKPTVSTAILGGATISTAESGGNVTSDGGADITERGVCWSIDANPTIDDSKSSDGISTGSFTSTITDLTYGVTYHIRAFATNCSGTGYGMDILYFHSTTGFNDIQSEEISIYPNPLSDILNIEYKNDNYKTINIISSQGVLLKKEKVNSPVQQLDFSKYEYGLYIIEFVKQSGELEQFKVIKR